MGSAISRSAIFILALAAGAWLGGSALAQSLPEGPSVIGPLHRDAQGHIEVIDPTKEEGTGPRRCAAGTICVGPGQTYTSLSDAASAAPDGATIELIAGTYRDTARIKAKNVTLRGIDGRPHIDCAGLRPANDKACVLLEGQGDTLENIEISGAEISASLGNNGACIRNGHDVSFTLRKIICHSSQDGALTDGGVILVEDSEFFDNGWDGQSHNVYFSGNCISVTVRGSLFHDARVGHEFKSRCAKTDISDSTFRSTKGSRDLDLPEGGNVMIYRSTIEKTAGAQSDEILEFTGENCNHPGDLVLKDVHILNRRNRAVLHNFDGCPGHPIVLENVTIEGQKPEEVGYIIRR